MRNEYYVKVHRLLWPFVHFVHPVDLKGPENLPEELPVGTLIYHAPEAPVMEDLEPVLDAREAERRDLPTLAQTLNDRLLGCAAEPAELEAADADS